MANVFINLDESRERFAYLIKLARMGALGGKPTQNSRILVSRNKREGWYFGLTTAKGDKRHVRTWSKPAALRYSHIQFGQVRFQGLGIQLFTPTGEPNGNT